MKDVIYEVYSNDEFNQVLEYLKDNGLQIRDFHRNSYACFCTRDAYYVGCINNTLRYNGENIWTNKPLIKGFNMKETMRKYQSFAISGTKSLLKAIEEELNLIGYHNNTEWSFLKGTENESDDCLISDSDNPKEKDFLPAPSSYINEEHKQFQLPQQWDECLAFCKGQLEPELKVGDWIYFLKSFDGKGKGYITQVEGIRKDKAVGCDQWVTYRRGGFRLRGTGNGYTLNVDFRLATKEEIEKATKIKVGTSTMEVVNGKAKFGCQYITKEEVITLRKFLGEPYHAKISMCNTEITTDLLNKILDRL